VRIIRLLPCLSRLQTGISIIDLILLDALYLAEVGVPLTLPLDVPLTLPLGDGEAALGLIVGDAADELREMVPLFLKMFDLLLDGVYSGVRKVALLEQ
jgi:hypothetical protein